MGQVGQKLVQNWSKIVQFGHIAVGDETVKWESCLRIHDTSSTPGTSVSAGEGTILFLITTGRSSNSIELNSNSDTCND